MKIKTIVMAIVLAIFATFLISCKQDGNKGKTPQVPSEPSIPSLPPPPPADARLKGSVWKDAKNNSLTFDNETAICTVNNEDKDQPYQVEYTIHSDKIELKLERAIHKYTYYKENNFLEDQKLSLQADCAYVEKTLKDPRLNDADREQMQGFLKDTKEALETKLGTVEGWKKYMLDVWLPYQIQKFKFIASGYDKKSKEREEYQKIIDFLEDLQSDASLETFMKEALKEKNQIASLITTLNPVTLTFEKDKTADTTTTLTSSKMFLCLGQSKDDPNKSEPIYLENGTVFTKQ